MKKWLEDELNKRCLYLYDKWYFNDIPKNISTIQVVSSRLYLREDDIILTIPNCLKIGFVTEEEYDQALSRADYLFRNIKWED